MLLMNSTVMSDIEPDSKQFTLCIEFGAEREYKFLLEDGSTRRARLNEFEPFAGIRDYAAVSVLLDFQCRRRSAVDRSVCCCSAAIWFHFSRCLPAITTTRATCFRFSSCR